MLQGHLTPIIAADPTSQLETIEEIKKKAAPPKEEKRFSDRLLFTQIQPRTANPEVDVVDYNPTLNDSRIRSVDGFLGIPHMTRFWRRLSDQFVRECIHESNKKEKEALDDNVSVFNHPPGLERTLDSDHRPMHTLPDVEPSSGALFPDNLLGSDEFAKHSSTSRTDDDDDDDESADDPYLDPDLVRHARSFRDLPHGIPRFVSVPSDDSLRDSQEQVVFGGSPKKVHNGWLEVHPGEFVEVHGIKLAQDAMKRGESAVVECGVCSTRYAVDESATALYCTVCDSVTEM